MQFLEHSILGLRAARHRLAAPDHPAEVTLFPMLHVGEAAFYDRVGADALGHDLVLVEGVRTRATWLLTRAYRWLPLKRLGLVVQPRLPAGAGGAEVILADLDPAAFHRLWRGLPWATRLLYAVAAPAWGAWMRLTATRGGIARAQSVTDGPDRETLIAAGTPAGGLLSVILLARDAELARVLSAQLDRVRAAAGAGEGPRRIAVVYGAAHMPAVSAALRRHGDFRPVESAWLEAIRL